MGASSSIALDLNIDIYLSYPEKTEFIERMTDNLQEMNFTVIESSLMIQRKKDLSPSEISKCMEELIEKTKLIFVCISKETIKSVTQILEMNEILDKYPTLEKKIIYFMMDLDYTPITNKELKCIIKNNIWFPLYDNDSLFYTKNKLLTLLIKI